ncbi:MAG TPA: hypothetical protein VHZ25_16990 [Acidobacteriaceae bacterium]|jgi:hypothetical protein|nr:hypothetical protein [Acidobacteriaceae bacterium]
MNQYLFLRRMRGPIILLTFGITAILDEYAGISYAHSWPLYVILWGLLKLAENAILAQNPPAPGTGYPVYPVTPGATGYTSYTGAAGVDAATATTGTIIPPEDTTVRDEGGR